MNVAERRGKAHERQAASPVWFISLVLVVIGTICVLRRRRPPVIVHARQSHPPATRPPHRRKISVGAAIIVLGATLGVVLVRDVPVASAEARSVLERVSKGPNGSEVTASSGSPSVSGNGRHTVFVTAAALDPADRNEADDVYVRDVASRTTTLMSRFSDGNGNSGDRSFDPAISGDGRYVVFASDNQDVPPAAGPKAFTAQPGTPLASGPTAQLVLDPPIPASDDGRTDIFIVDRGLPSGNGEFAEAPGPPVSVSHDDQGFSGATVASAPSISFDGTQVGYVLSRYVGPGDATRVAIRDRDRNANGIPEGGADEATVIVSTTLDGDDPQISGDGRHLVFVGRDPSLSGGAPRAVVYDRTVDGSLPLDREGNTRLPGVTTGQFTGSSNEGEARVDPLVGTASARPDISADGSVVVYQFRYDDENISSQLPYGTWQIISVSRGGDGMPVAALVLSSSNPLANNPAGNGHSTGAHISGDGRYVAFVSEATNLLINFVPPHNRTCSGVTSDGARCHAYVVDRVTPGPTVMVSSTAVRTPSGLPTYGDRPSTEVSVSADGRFVSFTSGATNLVAGDTDGVDDVILLEWTPRLHATPDPVTFGTTSVGASTPAVVVEVDTDDFGPWRAARPEVKGTVAGDFPVDPGACAEGSFSRGRPCLVPVSFQPTDTGHRGAVLEVSRAGFLADFGSPPATIEVSGKANVPEGPGGVERVSEGSPGVSYPGELPADSANPAISANGRYVAFESKLDLDPRDQNRETDVYVRDRLRDTTTIVSLRPTGTNPPPSCTGSGSCPQTTFASVQPSISGDGRYVAFTSGDSAMAPEGLQVGPGPANDFGATDVYLVDRGPADGAGNFRAAPAITNASVGPMGEPIPEGAREPSVSGDGSQIAFTATSSNILGGAVSATVVLIRDLDADGDGVFPEPGDSTTVALSPPLGAGPDPAISADGNHVALVGETAVDDGTGDFDSIVLIVYVYDRDVDGDRRRDQLGGTRYVGITTDQFTPPGPARPSGLDGTYSFQPAIDGDGTTVAYAFGYGDGSITSELPYDTAQVLVADRDRVTGEVISTEVASVAGPGPLADNAGDGPSVAPDLSDDGRYVAFATTATNLHADDPEARRGGCRVDMGTRRWSDGGPSPCDVLVVDRLAPGNAGAPQVASAPPQGIANGESQSPAISGDGRFVAFESVASDLLGTTNNPESPPPTPFQCPCDVDGNRARDVFVREWHPVLAVAPSSIEFPDTTVGTATGIRSVTLTTPSFGPAPILSVSVMGTNPGDFLVTGTSNCIPPLSSAAAAPVAPVPDYGIVRLDTPCVVSTAFLPTLAGARSAVLRVVAGSPFSNVPSVTFEIRLTGRALELPEPEIPPTLEIPDLRLDAVSIDFGELLVGTTSSAEVLTVTNFGTAALGIAAVDVVGLHPDDFSIISTTCRGRTLTAGEKCVVVVTFHPSVPGEREAVIQFDDTAPGTPHLVRLAGRAPAPTLAANPTVSIPGRAPMVTGAKWPPNTEVILTMTESERSNVGFPETVVVRTDADGRLRASMLVLPRGPIGPRLVVAAAGPTLKAVAPLLVVIPSINGPDFVVRG